MPDRNWLHDLVMPDLVSFQNLTSIYFTWKKVKISRLGSVVGPKPHRQSRATTAYDISRAQESCSILERGGDEEENAVDGDGRWVLVGGQIGIYS